MGPDDIPPILLSKCASVLYKPLHYLFDLTLKFGYLPCEWKVHKIIPVFKSGDPTHINNYRPISLLSNTSKVLERILHDKIIGHVTSRINPAQFGFIQNHSSVQQLLLVLSDIFTSCHQLDIIYLDITKAFDTISHSHLLHKLRMFNIGGELWSWFLAYVTNTMADPGWGIWGKCPPPFKKLRTRSRYSNRAVYYSNKVVTMFMR